MKEKIFRCCSQFATLLLTSIWIASILCILKFRELCHSTESTHPEMFCEKGVLKNFAKFTGKHLCQTFSFSKVAVLTPATLFKKKLLHRCFPVNFAKFLRTPFCIEHLWWLCLKAQNHYRSNKLVFFFRYF